MRHGKTTLLLLISAAALIGCGGGSGGEGDPTDGGSVTVAADFVPDDPSPDASTVTLQRGAASSNLITVRVDATGVSNIYGAAFELAFDGTLAEYVAVESRNLAPLPGDVDGEAVALLHDGRGGGIPDLDRVVRGDLGAAEAPQVGGVAPVVRQQVVGVAHRAVAVLARVEQQRAPVHAAERQGRLQARGAASDDDRVVHVVSSRLRSPPSCDFMST